MSKMSEPKQPSSAAVVIGGPGKKGIFKTVLQALLWRGRWGKVVGPVVAAVVVAGVALLIWSHFFAHQNVKTPPTSKTIAAQVNKELAQGNNDAAINAIKKSGLHDEPTNFLLITAYENKGDYASAVKVYQQTISQNGASLGLVEGAGSAAAQAGDVKTAISYYQQAIQLLKKDEKKDVQADAYIKYYNEQIVQLQPKGTKQ